MAIPPAIQVENKEEVDKVKKDGGNKIKRELDKSVKIQALSPSVKLSPDPHFSIFHSHKITTEGPAVQGGASRVLGGRDEIRSQSSTIERWIPPSAIKRDALPENSDDVKFRKVRGILNKLTPQTFDRLSDELIRIGLDSQVLLKGVILLIFEKALQEPKYVCMYAQLCKKLSKKVPNFDLPNPENTTTFRRLLLNKCQDEYENRARASARYDHRTNLTPEEEEEKQLAKRKMLGNIKFIGELGKLEMLTHSILHKCCEELVKKTKAEDLECLCQIMSTCGHLLDNDKGKYLMDQYFTRMKELSHFDKLPSRIRFMLQDVLELRDNHWLPRQSTSVKESPKPIQDIRREAHDELGISDGSRSPQDDFKYLRIDPQRNRLGKKTRTGMEDVFAPFPLAVANLGTGPGVINQANKPMGSESNGYHAGPMNNYRPAGGMRHYHNQNDMHNGPYYPQHKNNKINNHYVQQDRHGQQNMHHNMRNNMTNGYEKAPVAPRFQRQNHGQQIGGMSMNMPPVPQSGDEPSLRPPTTMIKMVPQTIKTNNAFIPTLNESKPITAPPMSTLNAMMIAKDSTLDPAKNQVEKAKPKKEKGPTKEDIVKKVDEIIEEYIQNKCEQEAEEAFKEVKIPERFMTEVMTSVLNKAMDRNESDREFIYNLILHIVKAELVIHVQFLDTFHNILDLMTDLEADIPRIKSYVAAYAARAIIQEVMTLAEVAEFTDNGNHFPFLLLVLQQLGKSMDKIKLCKMFEDSKVNLLYTLPKIDRTKDRMAEILEERELSFLFPLLKIQAEMTKQLQASSDPSDFLAWINEHVDSAYHTSQGFINGLITVVFKFIAADVADSFECNANNEKAIREKEKDLLLTFKPLLGTFLRDKSELQVISIYAMQAAWSAMGCPKAILLRWFMNLYDLDIIEEDSFLKWKEEICDDYPGKGKALFQVNQWLLWLEQAEEEEDDGEADQDN